MLNSPAARARRRDSDFTVFLERHRQNLTDAALLLWGDPEAAERSAQWAVAHAYAHGDHFFVTAVDGLLTDPHGLELPWRRGPRAELTDLGAPRPAVPGGSGGSEVKDVPAVVTRLAALRPRVREVLVLRLRLGLSAVGTAELLGVGEAEVEGALSRGLLELSDLGANGVGGPTALMQRVSLPSADPPGTWADDLDHGRRLVRRRRRRVSLVAAALVLVLAVVGTVLWPRQVTELQVSQPVPEVTSTPTASGAPGAGTPTCSDPRPPGCRVEITRAWRNRVFAAVSGDLDPEGKYFTSYTYGYDDRYDSDALWQDKGGALGLDLVNFGRGSTVVFVQVATSRNHAVRCGATTHHHCIHQQMMDFNYFTMTDTLDSRQGVEVQYRPDGTQVITLVAREVTKGPQLPISRGQLLEAIQDPALRLPKL